MTVIPAAILLFHVIAYFKDSSGLRSFPGPMLAKFTDAWMFSVVKDNKWSDTVAGLHKKYGTYLR